MSTNTPLFTLGQIVITTNAHATLSSTDVFSALSRHMRGDWGDVDSEDKKENDFSVNNNLRILSAYKDSNETKFWIITEADRSSTTILLPEDY